MKKEFVKPEPLEFWVFFFASVVESSPESRQFFGKNLCLFIYVEKQLHQNSSIACFMSGYECVSDDECQCIALDRSS